MINTEPQIKDKSKITKTYNMRCPACAKLYKVDAKLISSSSPHFDCEVCKTAFTFEYPPRHPHSIQTRPLSGGSKNPSFSKNASLHFNANHFKKCPKCQHINPKNLQECNQCRALFARTDGLPQDIKSAAFPSLVRMWQDLMSDYSNITKHVAFVDRCEDLQAIPFALKKYEMLKENQPYDEVADKMFSRVMMKSLGVGAHRMAEASQLKFLASKVNWLRVIKLSPLVLSLCLVIFGLMAHPLRNLVGVGVAIFVLTAGLRIFKSGGIRAADFY